jgi:hypothetical protein
MELRTFHSFPDDGTPVLARCQGHWNDQKRIIQEDGSLGDRKISHVAAGDRVVTLWHKFLKFKVLHTRTMIQGKLQAVVCWLTEQEQGEVGGTPGCHGCKDWRDRHGR